MTERAERLLNATLDLTLRPQAGDRARIVAAILREAADELCLGLAELQHPADFLNTLATEVEELR